MLTISDEELVSINRAVSSRYGVDFSNYEVTSLKRRVARVIERHQLESSIGLWRKILSDTQFIYTFIDEITVGLTELFRNADFWVHLREKIIPQWREKETIHIWQAGCSTGEEVYSLAILLHEEGLLPKARITATDLNSQSVKNAQEGTFSADYLKAYTKNYREAGGKKALDQYYTLEGDVMRFNKLNKTHFRFLQHNLVRDAIPGEFDIIFCRNVMIYFDEVLKMKTLELFNQCLRPDGYFAIGYYDVLPNAYKQFFDLYSPEVKMYRKK